MKERLIEIQDWSKQMQSVLSLFEQFSKHICAYVYVFIDHRIELPILNLVNF